MGSFDRTSAARSLRPVTQEAPAPEWAPHRFARYAAFGARVSGERWDVRVARLERRLVSRHALQALSGRLAYRLGVATDNAARPVTRAQRGFGAAELRALQRTDVRKLCHGLLLADAAVVNDYRSTAELDEFAVTVPGLWHMHRVLVRIYHRPIRQDDVEDARTFAIATEALESLVLPAQGSDDALVVVPGVTVISADEIAERIVSSALVRWDEDRPALATDRLHLMLRLASTALLDSVGIEALPSLALNEVPPSLVEYGIEPQDLLERKAFRLLTASFRFGGIRYGESARGKRLPDARLDWPDGSPTSALLDCKAASSGYLMDSDHFLRFVNYWETLAPQLEEEGRSLDYLIVLSSYFRGQEGQRHPYWNRAEQLADKTGLCLVYVTASDIAWAAARLESADKSLVARCGLDWHSLLRNGLVGSDHFDEAVDALVG